MPGGAGVPAALTDTALRALIEGWSHQHPEGRVVSQHRHGGQRQFAPTIKAQFTTQGTLGTLIEALFETAHRPWTLDTMARFSNQTPRSLSRHFKRGTKMSPVNHYRLTPVASFRGM